ncbi:MAG: hypothetical protein AAGB34_01385 [Planctomycetota bacterium]
MDHIGLRRAEWAAVLVVAVGALSGCTSTIRPMPADSALLGKSEPVRVEIGGGVSYQSALVFSRPEIEAWAVRSGVTDPARFEFGRRDALLSVRRPAALRATRSWPEQPRPVERPVIFERWDQR